MNFKIKLEKEFKKMKEEIKKVLEMLKEGKIKKAEQKLPFFNLNLSISHFIYIIGGIFQKFFIMGDNYIG